MSEKVIDSVVCPFCGSLCDDTEVVVKDGKIIETRNMCIMGTQKLFASQAPERIRKPMIREKGVVREVSLDEAIRRSAEILVKAERPLLYGWSSSECDTDRVGFELAEELGAVIDDTASVCHGPSVLAIQDVGLSSCTLGEVKNRADLIIYWGANPQHAHPRHMSRYTSFVRGFFRDKGVKERSIVVVDCRRTDTAKLATHFIQVEPNRDYELLSALRAVVNGHDLSSEKVAGVPREQIIELANMMKSSGFGIIFFGQGLTQSAGKHRNIDNAIQLTTDLNKFTKFLIMPMRGHYNVTGFGVVALWTTGYPFGVDFSRGYPRYNPGETTANDVLIKEEVDAALVVASDPVSHFPKKSIEHLVKIPLIVIEPHPTPTTELADVVIPPAVSGVEVEGTAYRMDNVPIRLRKVVDAPEGLLPDREIVRKILEKVRELRKK
ncbi:MAG: formylmethanofuran dehydrogenase subunit B [Candidatus Atabeyarchaeum deiterrae]